MVASRRFWSHTMALHTHAHADTEKVVTKNSSEFGMFWTLVWTTHSVTLF